MDSVAMTAFFSHSFNTDDEALTSFLVAIAQGVDISCKNVSEGHTATPNNVAKKMITESDLFIAAITKQDKLENGKYMMSSAVRDEITMAFTLGKPSLLLVEKDVKVDGFFPQMGTYIEFERANLSNPDMLQKLVSSIHRLKVDSLSAHNILISQQQGWGDFYAENVETLIELNKDGDGFIWEYQMTRDLLFISDLKYPIKYYSWPTCQIAKIDKERPDYRVEYDYKITNSSKKCPINASQNVSTHTHDTIKFENVFDPVPVAGDRITEQISFKSPYFNPLYKEQIIGKRPDYTLDKKDFFCTEGIVATM